MSGFELDAYQDHPEHSDRDHARLRVDADGGWFLTSNGPDMLFEYGVGADEPVQFRIVREDVEAFARWVLGIKEEQR